jgi:lipopolysaccharide/colanic/teichoic acid biosynthesis glycosyltransferase
MLELRVAVTDVAAHTLGRHTTEPSQCLLEATRANVRGGCEQDQQAHITGRLRGASEPAIPRVATIPIAVSRLSPRELAVKRFVDVAVTLALLPVAIVVGAIAALLIRIGSPGPVLYRQVRVGFGGRHFVLYKLRTMVEDAEAREGATLPRLHDSRLTGVGRQLKALHLDELPQLWNVLKGDMSLVGPRPERPIFVARFASQIAGYERRHEVPVGLTGLAQLKGSHATVAEDKLVFDVAYASGWSIFFDLKLLARTPIVVLRPSVRSVQPATEQPTPPAAPELICEAA